DVPVVLDKMIHDLDILLFLVNSDIEKVYANGISILTDSIDIANSRIRFKNGTIANVTSSRVAQGDVRKIKIFQQDLYVTIDLLIGLTEVYRVINKKEKYINSIQDVDFDYRGKKKHIIYEKPELLSFDALKAELENFSESIYGDSTPMVDGVAAKNALELAITIDQMIREDLH
ncbi:MAG: gfo/Idh/MocA family oxidoreductase, partial [Candidatus Marinimicrobia bacterium]|nr:gfo/Idh/MocA family oxidoreductase [Candidatus Neomarinimicrobiota bacterium]